MTYLRDDTTGWVEAVMPIERLANKVRWPAAPGWTLVRTAADGELCPVAVRHGDDQDLIEDLP
jgi:hypothetical protein